MKLLRSFPVMAFALVLLSIVGLCAAQGSVELLLVASTLAALSWYVTEGPRGRTLPKWVSNVLVIAVSLSVVAHLVQSGSDWLAGLGRFTVWITLVKLYERRTARDHIHLMGLSLLLMLVGCLQSTQLLFGAVLIAYILLGLYVLLLFQLYAGYEQAEIARRAALPASTSPAPPARPTIGRRAILHFRGLTLAIALAGVASSAGLFVIVPRNVGRGLFGEAPLPPRVTTTGYGDEVDLEAGTRITSSRREVFDVQVLGDRGEPQRLDGPLLLRGATLDRYEDGRWTSTGSRRQRIESTSAEPARLGEEPATGADQTLRFRFRRGTSTVFTRYLPTTIRTDRPRLLTYDPVTQTVRAPADGGAVWGYTVTSIPDPDDDQVANASFGLVPASMPTGRFRDSADPQVPRVRSLALDLLRRGGLPTSPPRGSSRWSFNEAAARTFAGHLASDSFTYTTDLSGVIASSSDPIVHFLFVSRRGHCEFFASALVAMCHSVGIDGRLVTGYAAYEYDEAAQRYVVRAANAHAWTEVRTGRYRYTTVDPTPAAVYRAPARSQRTFADEMGSLYQRLEGAWASRVIGFDERSQTHLLDVLESSWPNRFTAAVSSVREWMRQVNRAFYFGSWGYIWMGIVALAGVIALVAVVKLVRRVQLIRRTARLRSLADAESRRQLRQLGFYVDMLVVLRRAGCPKPSWQPPVEFTRTLDETRPAAAALVREVTGVFYEVRYGGRTLRADEIAGVSVLIRRLATALRVRS